MYHEYKYILFSYNLNIDNISIFALSNLKIMSKLTVWKT